MNFIAVSGLELAVELIGLSGKPACRMKKITAISASAELFFLSLRIMI